MSAVIVMDKWNQTRWKSYLQEGQWDSMSAILDYGKRVFEYKQSCERKSGGSCFAKDVQEWLCMSQSAADRWVQIGKASPELTQLSGNLPMSRSALYEVATMDAVWRAKGIADGVINPEVTVGELQDFKYQCKREEMTEEEREAENQRNAEEEAHKEQQTEDRDRKKEEELDELLKGKFTMGGKPGESVAYVITLTKTELRQLRGLLHPDRINDLKTARKNMEMILAVINAKAKAGVV